MKPAYTFLVFLGACVALVIPFLPSTVLADCPPGAICPSGPNISDLGGVKNVVLCGVLNWLFTVAIVLSVGFVLWAGISYITSSGNPETTSKVHKALLFAAVGVAVAVLAKGVPIMIGAFVNGGNAGFTSKDICPL